MSGPDRPDDARYRELIAREAAHWGRGPDPEQPQIWDDPRLEELILAPPHRRLVERAVAAGGPVLELGCGDGDLTLELAERGLRIEGIDLSPERIARARAWADERGLSDRASFRIGDLNRASFPEGQYACVVAHQALHHILDLDHLMDAVRTALQPGGRLLISDYIGAGFLEKLVVASLYAVLPTRASYAAKWGRHRRRLSAYLASEKRKREVFDAGGGALHDESPFEGISQESIVRTAAARFEIVERFTFCPFWYHLVPKLRAPRRLQHAIIAGWLPVDRVLHRTGLARGSYCFIEATRSA